MIEKRRCNSPNCLNDACKWRTKCHKCMARSYRAAHPIMHAYHNIKSRAKVRGHKFKLSFKYFKEFCERTNYTQLKGTGANDMTIDKIIDKLGYVDGNIQMISNSDNVKKWRKDREKSWSFDVGVVDTPF